MKLEKKSRELLFKMKELLPEEHRNLLLQYEECLVIQETISQDIFYAHGLKEGITLGVTDLSYLSKAIKEISLIKK